MLIKEAILKPKEVKKYEFQGLLVILLAILVLTGVQTFQLYSMKNTLAKEGLSTFSQGGTGQGRALGGSVLPDQVGGCFR